LNGSRETLRSRGHCRFIGYHLTRTRQAQLDEEAVHNLPYAFCTAFKRHDGHQLAQMVADDIDFVTVGATWLHGKPDFEKCHTRLLNGRFHRMTLEPLQVAVRFIRPDIAIVHWSWTGAGDKNPGGTARQRRYGMMTMVVEKRIGSWLVVASQNDDSFPGLPPEFEGITHRFQFLTRPVPSRLTSECCDGSLPVPRLSGLGSRPFLGIVTHLTS
jgi:uncharacterized protein (TIGR02246 family)